MVEARKYNIDVDDLFRLQKVAFVLELALSKARESDLEVQIKISEIKSMR
jgi:hypothetical protein